MGDAPVRLCLLGGFEVVVAGRSVSETLRRRRKAADLVKLLALAPGQRLHREQLIELLWPDRPLAAAANNLHQAMHVARRAIELPAGRALALEQDIAQLCPDGPAEIDVVAFEQAAQLAAGSNDETAHERALAFYAGELLPDDRYAEWTLHRREALRRAAITLWVELAELRLDAGKLAAAERNLQRMLDEEPTHEPAHRLLMRVHVRSGRPQLALRQYQVLAAAVREEFGVAPEQASQRLRQDVLAEMASAPEPPAKPGPPGPRRVSGAPRRHNLPVSLSTFIGRENEIAAVTRAVRRGRLVTLTGSGGCGKTRLALEAAEGLLANFPDGVWFADLAPLTGEAGVVEEVAEALGVGDISAGDRVAAVSAHVAQRRVLLVLDNCEHRIGPCARLVERLLGAAPDLRVLATSREPLRLPGERVHRVPSLSLPPVGESLPMAQLLGYEAPRLFIERARAIDPDRPITEADAVAVSAVCHRLDGMPLAIELAAARLPVLTVEGIAARLDDRFRLLTTGSITALTRQQTLKATVDWSHDLLLPAERILFRRLAVFAGGFEMAAAEEVCASADLAASELLDVLSGLVAKSLVTALGVPTAGRDGPRFRLLETMRAYGWDRLREAGETGALRRRHAGWAGALSERAAPGLRSPQRREWLQRLEQERDNARAALRWLIEHEPQAALRLGSRLWPFWLWRGYLSEGLHWLRQALRASPSPSAERAEALLGVCALSVRSGRPAEGRRAAEESVEVALAVDDPRMISRALFFEGVTNWLSDRYAVARARLERSREVANLIGNRAAATAIEQALGVVAWSTGDFAWAEARLGNALAMVRELVDDPDAVLTVLILGGIARWSRADGGSRVVFEHTFAPYQEVHAAAAVGYLLANLGCLARAAGDLEAAGQLLVRSVAAFQEIGDGSGEAHALTSLGNLEAASGEFDAAETHLRRSLRLCRETHALRGHGLALAGLGRLAATQGRYKSAHDHLHEAKSLFEDTGDLPGLAGVLSDLGELARVQHDHATARAMFGQALTLNRQFDHDARTAWALVDLAELEHTDGDHGRSDEFVAEAIEIFRRIGDSRGLALCEERRTSAA